MSFVICSFYRTLVVDGPSRPKTIRGYQTQMMTSDNRRDEQPLPRVITTAEARKYGGVGKTTLFAEMKAGRLRYFHRGRRRLITVDNFKAWLNQHGAEI
jgi:excisionase family DNA binding protein